MDIKAMPVKEIYNNHQGYQVVLFQHEESKDMFTAFGPMLPVGKINVILHGNYVTTKKYGKQFSVSSFEEIIPQGDAEAIYDYLVAAKITHIGAATARKIVDAFGDQAIEVLDNEPERIAGIRGISVNKAKEIIESYRAKRSMMETTMYMQKFGIPLKKLKQLESFRCPVKELFEEHPYWLCNLSGVTYRNIDNGLKKDHRFQALSYERLKAVIRYVLKNNEDCGHLFMLPEDVVDSAYKLLNEGVVEDVSKANIKQVVNAMVKKDLIKYDHRVIYRKEAYEAEVCCAKEVVRMVSGKNTVYPEDKLRQMITEAEKKLGFTLDETQKSAVVFAFTHNISIITGGPGMGKTTLLTFIIEISRKLEEDSRISLCAPTGRAARRMSEATQMEAITMHKLLGLTDDESVPVDTIAAGLIVADEFSMVDQFLAYKFFRSISSESRVVLVGDVNQLPSVRAGNVFKELIESKVIPTTVLSTIYRQDADNSIIVNSQKINTGQTDLVFDNHTVFIPCTSDEKTVELIVEKLMELKQSYSEDSIEVLSPLRRKTDICSNSINTVLQDILNPSVLHKPEAVVMKQTWRYHDRVIQTKNKEAVSNGDTGKIVQINKEGESLTVAFDTGTVIDYDFSEAMEELMLGYALTIHKSQGSEYPVVIIPLGNSFNCKCMMKRNLLYTGVTRAKNMVIMIGSREMLYYAIANADTDARNTYLMKRILELLHEQMSDTSQSKEVEMVQLTLDLS